MKDLMEHLATVRYDDYCALLSRALPDVERSVYSSRATHFNINATAGMLWEKTGLWDRRPGDFITDMKRYEARGRRSKVPAAVSEPAVPTTPTPSTRREITSTSQSTLPATPKSSVMRVLSPSRKAVSSELSNAELTKVFAVQ